MAEAKFGGRFRCQANRFSSNLLIAGGQESLESLPAKFQSKCFALAIGVDSQNFTFVMHSQSAFHLGRGIPLWGLNKIISYQGVRQAKYLPAGFFKGSKRGSKEDQGFQTICCGFLHV